MTKSGVKKLLQETVKAGQLAESVIQDEDKGKENQDIDSEIERLEREIQEGKKAVIVTALDAQNWRDAEEHANEVGFSEKDYKEFLAEHIEIRKKEGEKRVAQIANDLKQLEKDIEMIEFNRNSSQESQAKKDALQRYKEINGQYLLEAQRRFSIAENVLEYTLNRYSKLKQVDTFQKWSKELEETHDTVNKLDKILDDAKERLRNEINS